MAKRFFQIITSSFIGLTCISSEGKCMEKEEVIYETVWKSHLIRTKVTREPPNKILIAPGSHIMCQTCKDEIDMDYFYNHGPGYDQDRKYNCYEWRRSRSHSILKCEIEEKSKKEEENSYKQQIEEQRRKEEEMRKERERQELIRQENINNAKKDVIPDTEELYKEMIKNMTFKRSIITNLDLLSDL